MKKTYKIFKIQTLTIGTKIISFLLKTNFSLFFCDFFKNFYVLNKIALKIHIFYVFLRPNVRNEFDKIYYDKNYPLETEQVNKKS